MSKTALLDESQTLTAMIPTDPLSTREAGVIGGARPLCAGKVSLHRCTTALDSPVHKFCLVHYQASRQAYTSYKALSEKFATAYESYCQTKTVLAQTIGTLQHLAQSAYQSRSEFARKYVHKSCHDVGHTVSMELYKNMANFFERQLNMMLINRQQEQQRQSEELMEHRARLQDDTRKKKQLDDERASLHQQWLQDRQASIRKERKKIEGEKRRLENEELRTAVATTRKAIVREVKEVVRRERTADLPKWVDEVIDLFYGFLMSRIECTSLDGIDDLFQADISFGCTMFRHFYMFIFGRQVELYHHSFIQHVAQTYELNESDVQEFFNRTDESSVLFFLEGALGSTMLKCLEPTDIARVKVRRSRLAANIDYIVMFDPANITIKRGGRPEALDVYFDRYMLKSHPQGFMKQQLERRGRRCQVEEIEQRPIAKMRNDFIDREMTALKLGNKLPTRLDYLRLNASRQETFEIIDEQCRYNWMQSQKYMLQGWINYLDTDHSHWDKMLIVLSPDIDYAFDQLCAELAVEEMDEIIEASGFMVLPNEQPPSIDDYLGCAVYVDRSEGPRELQCDAIRRWMEDPERRKIKLVLLCNYNVTYPESFSNHVDKVCLWDHETCPCCGEPLEEEGHAAPPTPAAADESKVALSISGL